MRAGWMTLGAVGLAALGTLAYAAGRARAGGIPAVEPMSYSGALTDANGAPLSGMKKIQVVLWDQPALGSSQCSAGPADINLEVGGSFQLRLPNECTAVVRTKSDLWVELIVDSVLLPRTKLGAVPFAVEADHAAAADSASGALKTTIDGLSARGARVVRVEDTRTGCPPAAAADADLLTASFTLTKATPVYINADMIRRYNGRADLSLLVDGVLRTVALSITTTPDWAPAQMVWAGTLDPGAHNVVMRSGQPGAYAVADIWGCGAAHGALTVLIFE